MNAGWIWWTSIIRRCPLIKLKTELHHASLLKNIIKKKKVTKAYVYLSFYHLPESDFQALQFPI